MKMSCDGRAGSATGAWAPVMPTFPSQAPRTPPWSALAEGSARLTGTPSWSSLMPLDR
ncbi:FXYD domain-containing ion transport regulator 2, isoform CRA_f [Rattus norvegicus]|uniref:FXYD domain-containing ion transport regulator 2, isoform CRA_f n=1 Tax=Rattus norvegicus TaxID=10116 RepID=A6J446_RAT|nr:FXYD domain-containing ion transport regulator 2, isoform CRA_f [Rattus norvegicus]EDL95370.1 FXYD domain-containing ion transport regulator 2, isoform CRA_f [Rattus norvegicus]